MFEIGKKAHPMKGAITTSHYTLTELRVTSSHSISYRVESLPGVHSA